MVSLESLAFIGALLCISRKYDRVLIHSFEYVVFGTAAATFIVFMCAECACTPYIYYVGRHALLMLVPRVPPVNTEEAACLNPL